MKNVISIRDLSREEILHLLDQGEKIEKGELKPDHSETVMSIVFFESSTRTRFSFETAMKRMNGKVITMSGTKGTSVDKGESLGDTLKTVANYSDIMVVRSGLEGTQRYASEIIPIPVINAGDGSNQHPTQCLLDLYSIRKTQGKLDNLSIAVVGDLRYGRAVHSLVYGLSHFSPKLHLISPDFLKIPEYIKTDLEDKNIEIHEGSDLSEVINKVDIMYVTRIQKERFSDLDAYERVKNCYVVSKSMFGDVKPNFKLLHPLPRVDEISTDVDDTKHAYYFQQAKNGVYIRQAIISELLGGSK
ncbi:aspartate carbamoyltransferase [bacterium]|nr:aspartate carbamoyltransferase [bacterium]